MIEDAPEEQEVYPKLIDFLGGALHGEVVMCAHNAKFDFDFLCNTLARLGFDANIIYIDTLALARKYLHGIENYKQRTIERYYGFVNESAHRADSDAENCGYILWKLMDSAKMSWESEKRRVEQNRPNSRELEVYAYIQKIISEHGGDTKFLRCLKNSSGYIDINCLYSILKIKFAKKGNYVLIETSCSEVKQYISEACTQNEGGKEYIRVYFSSPFELEKLSDYIFEKFRKSYESLEGYMAYSGKTDRDIENSLSMMCRLSEDEVLAFLESVRKQKYDSLSFSPDNVPESPHDSIEINAVNKRPSMSEIYNLGNEEKGFKMGFPYWEQGESERKSGNFARAIELFDKARLNGYVSPALYDSYALTYRSLKDYSNEISILDEGIIRIPEKSNLWQTRRDKAKSLLSKKKEAEKRATDKKTKKTEVSTERVSTNIKRSNGRVILQLDDEGNIIAEFDTIVAAAKQVGVSSKSIRNAANGIQKHAGGFMWKYKE